MFWKKSNNEINILCPSCEWKPDGRKYWSCSCGNKWNTFKTKGKCPKCQKQWKETRCPGCGDLTEHEDWYKTDQEVAVMIEKMEPYLRKKKLSLESRLIELGIKNMRIRHPKHLEHENEVFKSTYDAGCRMMILYAISYGSQCLEDRDNIVQWLKDENIWIKVSPKEQKFLIDPSPSEDTIMDLSWKIEAAVTLAWSLNLINDLPKISSKNTQHCIDEFENNVPELGEPLSEFLNNLNYRDFAEIYEENLLNELATTYFRDLLFNGEKDETKIDRCLSFERHIVLNWLRSFHYQLEDSDEVTGDMWDETDTST